jgi:Domain of unknown function (DUF4279)
LTDLIGLTSRNFWKIGDSYKFGSANSNGERIRTSNFWCFDKFAESNEYIGDLAEDFIDKVIVPRITVIKSLTDKYHGEFSLVQYMYEGCNPGFCLNKKHIDILSKCGLSLNVDFYVLSQSEV